MKNYKTISYFLMHKDKMLASLNFSVEGILMQAVNVGFKENFRFLPLEESKRFVLHKNYPDEITAGLKKWWQNRSVPVTQEAVSEMLIKNGYNIPGEFLMSNLGLSLTDCYWIKPAGGDFEKLTWGEVNLFSNDFVNNRLVVPKTLSPEAKYTANASIQGNLLKTWVIKEDGTRAMVKSNRGQLSVESINEVIASNIHNLQGKIAGIDYIDYKLIKAHDETNYIPSYWCCISDNYVNNDSKEYVSAWSAYTSSKDINNLNKFENLIYKFKKLGLKEQEIRDFLDYQTLSDYVITNTDRHLANFGFLRDTTTLEPISMAPIFDSGNSLGKSILIGNDLNGYRILTSKKEIFNLGCSGIASEEVKGLKYVTNRALFDLKKLPPFEYIKDMYSQDSSCPQQLIDATCDLYKFKIDLLNEFQCGKNIWESKKYSISRGYAGISCNTIKKEPISRIPKLDEKVEVFDVDDKFDKKRSVVVTKDNYSFVLKDYPNLSNDVGFNLLVRNVSKVAIAGLSDSLLKYLKTKIKQYEKTVR